MSRYDIIKLWLRLMLIKGAGCVTQSSCQKALEHFSAKTVDPLSAKSGIKNTTSQNEPRLSVAKEIRAKLLKRAMPGIEILKNIVSMPEIVITKWMKINARLDIRRGMVCEVEKLLKPKLVRIAKKRAAWRCTTIKGMCRNIGSIYCGYAQVATKRLINKEGL